MEFVNKIPNWLRVFLVLPAAFFALFTVGFVAKTSLSVFWAVGSYFEHGKFVLDNFDAFVLEPVASGLSAYAFVWVGARVTPKYNFVVSVGLIVLLVFMLGEAFCLKIFFEDRANTSWPVLIVSAVVTIFAGIRAAMVVQESDKGEQFKFLRLLCKGGRDDS